MKNRAIILLILFVGFYIFLLSYAAAVEFAPCEPSNYNRQAFVFLSPVILPLLTSIIVYCWIMRRSEKPIIDYLKAFLFSTVGILLCVFFALYVVGTIWTLLENNFYDTDTYKRISEIKCGCDDEMMKDFPFSLIISIGTMVGGVILWCFVSLQTQVTKSIKKMNK